MITEAFVAGLTQENARRLIDRAKSLGLPASVVRTTDGGFIVPAVVAEDGPAQVPTEPEPEDVPEESTALTGSAERAEEPEAPAPKKRAYMRKKKTEPEPDPDDDATADTVTSEE